jgi:hypothetical protein
VTDRVLLLELLPRGAGGAAPTATSPPPAPDRAAPTTPDPVVMGASPQAPPTTAAARDGAAAAARPTAALDPASRSPLAFTGATALSMLGASLLLTLVGLAALFASRRRYHPRH